jgi:hypothetical protein
MAAAENHPGGLTLTSGGGKQQGSPLPEIAEQLGQPSAHSLWPPADLAAQFGDTVSPAVLRSRCGPASAQGYAGDGDPGCPGSPR